MQNSRTLLFSWLNSSDGHKQNIEIILAMLLLINCRISPGSNPSLVLIKFGVFEELFATKFLKIALNWVREAFIWIDCPCKEASIFLPNSTPAKSANVKLKNQIILGVIVSLNLNEFTYLFIRIDL